MKRCLLLALAMVVLVGALGADLGDFKDKFEADEARERTESEKDKEDDADDDTASEGESAFFKAFWEAMFEFFFYVNSRTRYQSSPYLADGSAFCLYPENQAEDLEDLRWAAGSRDGWFLTEARATWSEGLGWSAGAMARGRFWRLFGPRVEYDMVMDGSDWLGKLRLGLQFGVVQTDPFSLDWFVAWERWTGILDRSGVALGAEIRSLPGKPWILEASYGANLFRDADIHEVELRLGVVLDGWQCTAGYRFQNGTGGFYHGPVLAIGGYW